MAYVFIASTGRCGTKFMTYVWHYFTEYPSFHEPVPKCTGQTLREVNNECGMNKNSREELRTKLLQISGDAKDGNYFESNQMFIKSYLHLITYKKEFRPLYVIYLYRNPIETTMSYFKKNSKHELSWHLQPQWQKNIMRGRKGLSFHEISLWQCLEIRERFLLWKEKFDKTYELDFRKISDPEEHRKIFAHFEIEHTLPAVFPEDFFDPKTKNSNEVDEDRSLTFKELLEDWDARGQDLTKSAQDEFFDQKEQQIRELKQNKGEKRNEAK